jgi:hypothetical protein
MNAYRPLAIGAAWIAVAFAVDTLFSIVTIGGPTSFVAIAYLVAFGATFALHRSTRGRPLLVLAFGLGAALLVKGVSFAYAAEETSLSRRIGVAIALGLPLVALVARRWSVDADDAWFRRHARRVVPGALVLAFPLLVIGLVGANTADPSQYDRALGILDCHTMPFAWRPIAPAGDEHQMARFLSPVSGVAPSIQAEVRERCRRFDAAKEASCDCGHGLLSRKVAAIEKRRGGFRKAALASSLPFAIALLFVWRGRRRQSES